MKTIFDRATRDELIGRISLLNENSTAQWGKMNMYQMLKHCTLYDEWTLGKHNPKYKQVFIGRLFGRLALTELIGDEKPLKRNVGTLNSLKVIQANGDVALEKLKWVALIEEFENFSNPGFIHTFFGKLTREQIGYLGYKHTDHHLRQFGV
jgi:Protein of unknown function (DUF1569)